MTQKGEQQRQPTEVPRKEREDDAENLGEPKRLVGRMKKVDGTRKANATTVVGRLLHVDERTAIGEEQNGFRNELQQ